MNSTSDSSASIVISWPLGGLTFVISPVLSSTSPLCRVRRSICPLNQLSTHLEFPSGFGVFRGCGAAAFYRLRAARKEQRQGITSREPHKHKAWSSPGFRVCGRERVRPRMRAVMAHSRSNHCMLTLVMRSELTRSKTRVDELDPWQCSKRRVLKVVGGVNGQVETIID